MESVRSTFPAVSQPPLRCSPCIASVSIMHAHSPLEFHQQCYFRSGTPAPGGVRGGQQAPPARQSALCFLCRDRLLPRCLLGAFTVPRRLSPVRGVGPPVPSQAPRGHGSMRLWIGFCPKLDLLLHAYRPPMASQRPPGACRGPPTAGSPAARCSQRVLALTRQSGSRSRPRSVSGPHRLPASSRAGPSVYMGRAASHCSAAPSTSKGGSPGLLPAAPAPPGQQGEPAEVQAASRPSVPAPRRLAPQIEAAAPIKELGLQSLSVRLAQSRPRIPPGVAARAQQLPGQSSTQRSRLNSNRPRDDTLLLDFPVGPSGARDLGVRHLQTLGHAPKFGKQCKPSTKLIMSPKVSFVVKGFNTV
ncbi:hypothetical protein NDU88_012977 [Pleurodeles waltl]|uniref:Uncharacterized protein n=1 Tax=Pleurodeles waltl TaxID=8319 RepID=A0AAV7R3A3_PLEWA|nr:hypothetical protein NDU88_012977 [Pleurodeles waltl]